MAETIIDGRDADDVILQNGGLPVSDTPPYGAGVDGTRDLTSANTWYSVPSTVPSVDYVLVATIENAVGTIRWGYGGSGSPSSTNGCLAPSVLTLRLKAGHVVYFASSIAADQVNWTTKVI